MASRLVMITALLVTMLNLDAALPVSNDELKDCVMMPTIWMPPPIEQNFLVFVTNWPPVVLVFKFHEVHDAQTRDGVNITNSKIVHSKVRNGETTEHPLDMPKRIPDGWNILSLAVTERSLDVTLVESEGYVHLLTLPLDYNVQEMYMEDAALCSKASPEWKVPEGEEVTVPLQPEGSGEKQWIEVTALNSARPYIKFIGEDKKFPVAGNSTLVVSISLHWNYSVITVFKDEEEVGSSNESLVAPRKLIVGGASHVGLDLSHSPASPTCLPTDNQSWPLGLGCFTSGVVMGVAMSVVLHYLRRKKRLSRNNSDGNGPTDASGIATHEDEREARGTNLNTNRILGDLYAVVG